MSGNFPRRKPRTSVRGWPIAVIGDGASHSDYRDGIALVSAGKAITAIKLYRELTGAGLIAAETIVESV